MHSIQQALDQVVDVLLGLARATKAVTVRHNGRSPKGSSCVRFAVSAAVTADRNPPCQPYVRHPAGFGVWLVGHDWRLNVISSNSSIENPGEAVPDAAAMPERVVPDPAPRPVRRSFTAAYRLAIVQEYESAPRGEKGAVLRREGLYHSHIKEWTAARAAGARSGLNDSSRSVSGSLWG